MDSSKNLRDKLRSDILKKLKPSPNNSKNNNESSTLLSTNNSIKRNKILNIPNINYSSGKNSYKLKKNLTSRTTNLSSSQSRTIDVTRRKIKKKIIYNNPLNNPLSNENLIKLLKNPEKKRKYKLILDNHPILPIVYKGLPDNIINLNKKYKNRLKKENENIFDYSFSLISKNNFSSKFQNKLLLFDKNNNIKEKEKLMKFDAIKAFKTHKLNIEGKIKKDESSYKKMVRLKLKSIILKAALHFKRCDLTLNELLENKLNIKARYERKEILNSLIKAIKDKNMSLSLEILNENKQSVFLFDIYNQTPLHWASKRNFYQIIPKILSYGANIDSIDFTGYTPLHLSIINNNFDSFVILILFGASPFIHDNFGNKPIDYCRHFNFINLIKKATIIHIGNLFGKVKSFYDDLQRNLSLFIESEFRHVIQDDCAKIVNSVFNNKKL